ncbi:hypothetical protein DZB84_24565 [Bacillus sp. HNG]|uniref:hypothetical protein n=1 Tax=Bacillus sp. HNG TaxID=2293325 RepID=UPI000E2FD0EF|nr:hypothetical protein [Bacillus sp. HNG]RFB09085.1 hypothetical protein DZB84_24565 [Bacillus sp. HNG]
MNNKLNIPEKGTSFCFECFQFEEMSVQVLEQKETVTVKLTCGCGAVQMASADKNTFYEYDQEPQSQLTV